ncbi:zinc finger translocation-associated protein isoform X1 [Ranitomeya variabilis]|uniref:zinc finger translocation-associated protein isoform X1 n=1 Tax=Ranitomeya variabilis TaxID=490064 RepID=UPI00405613AF
MQSPKLQEGEPDVTVGPETGPAGELPAGSGELEPDNTITDMKKETGCPGKMQSPKLQEGELDVTVGPKTGPAGELPAESGELQPDNPITAMKEEAAGDTSYASSIDAKYPDPSDSFPGGLFPGSFDWSTPASSSEGQNNIGGVAGQEACEERASRPGNSRVPGKDHRRYYHNYWRLEYLMDYNPLCHSMICMVCGSSLATLKLCTIKRHIRQKHPYSLNWTPCEKELIIGSWDAHLCVDAQTLAGSEEHMAENMKAKTGPKKKRRRLPPVAKGTWRPVLGPECPLPSPMDKTQLEQYMNESLKRWFRLEFLMDYDYQGNQLHCMMCTVTLPSLCLTDIKHHILDSHPTSLQFSHFQKSVIIDAWINRKENPEMDLEGDMNPEMKEDMDDAEEEAKLAKKDGKCDTVAQKTAKPRPKSRKLKAKSSPNLMEKDIEFGEEKTNNCSTELMEEEERLKTSDMELLEDEESITGDVQLHDKEEWDAKDLQRIADEEWKVRKKHLLESLRILEQQQKPREEHGARKGQFLEEEKETRLLKEEKKPREKQLLEEQEKDRASALLEKPQKSTDAQLPEGEKMKAQESNLQEEKERKAEETQLQEEETRKAKEAHNQEEEKKNAHEVQVQEEEKTKPKEAELSEEEKPNAKEMHLLEEEKTREDHQLEEKKTNAKEAHLLEEENGNTTEGQLLDEDMIKIEELDIMEIEELELDTPKDHEVKLEEEQEVSNEVENVDREITVKLEDHQYADVSMNKTEKTQIINHVQAEKIQVTAKMGEGGKPQLKVTETRIIKVTPMPQAPTVLGIGLPMIKMKAPTPIIITRVSVLPEHAILQATKPKPSTSTAEISKTYRVIAPKVTPTDNQNQTLPASIDASQSPAGVDPTVWEVSVSRANSGNLNPSNMYQTRWRSEYLMDFNGVRGSVVCMFCSSSLTVLKESSIRRHIAQKHAHTGLFTAEEKAAVILDWENKLTEVKKIGVKPNKEGSVIGGPEEEESNWTGVLPEGKGASWEFAFGRLQGKVKDPGRYQHDRWKLEFLMDYTPAKDGLICMVCGAMLMNPKISTVKMHIQQKHPDTTYLSDQEKAVVMEEWEQKIAAGHKPGRHAHGGDEICIEINEDSTTSERNGSSVAVSSPHPEIVLPTLSKTPKATPSLPPPCNSAKPNYQVRWRTEFMMDYDCRRQGLICMVCGGTLATLKVSTIKRHIVQVHPYSVDFTAEERKRILDAYSEMALHYIHSEECFKTPPQEEVKGRKRKSAAMLES